MTDSERRNTTVVDGSEGPLFGPDVVFDLLKDESRRHLLYYFRGRPREVVTVDELADHLRGRFDARPEADTDRFELQLVHNHLPKLDHLGVIEYDPQDETVRYRGGTEIERFVDCANPRERCPRATD